MLRIHAARWLARAADIETVRDIDVHELIRILGYPRANYREVFLAIATRCARVNERGRARAQVAEANHSRFEVGG